MTVQDLQTRHMWHFFCECWLSSERGDGMTKKTFNAAKVNEVASFRLELESLYTAENKLLITSLTLSYYFCHCVFLCPLSGTFSRPEHRLDLETNTSGCPSWILPHAARSHVPRGFLAACAFCSVPWPSTSPSGTSLWIQTQQYSFQWVITKS